VWAANEPEKVEEQGREIERLKAALHKLQACDIGSVAQETDQSLPSRIQSPIRMGNYLGGAWRGRRGPPCLVGFDQDCLPVVPPDPDLMQ
jgi:hypothetical protein